MLKGLLDRYGNAEQRLALALRQRPVRGSGRDESPLEVAHDHRIDARILRLDPLDRLIQQFGCGYLAAVEHAAQLADAAIRKAVIPGGSCVALGESRILSGSRYDGRGGAGRHQKRTPVEEVCAWKYRLLL